MNSRKKQEIAKVIIKLLKSRFDTFPEDATAPRNAPFHKAFLQAFSDKFDAAGTNVDAMISMSSWMHGLNTTLGQVFFESVAHILCDGGKRGFNGSEFRIYAEQERIIAEIMTDLKNGDRTPDMIAEDVLIKAGEHGELVTGTNFTADCYFEDEENIVAIELKSVRPNSGETRGEKQKILKAKAALRIMYPDKNVSYFFGFPFDPTADTDTGYCQERFMGNMIEFPKFCDKEEILLADGLWSYLSREEGTMQELLDLIRSIATANFMDEFNFISTPNNLISDTDKYIEIAARWCLEDEIAIANAINSLKTSKDRCVRKSIFVCAFDTSGQYNERRSTTLLSAI